MKYDEMEYLPAERPRAGEHPGPVARFRRYFSNGCRIGRRGNGEETAKHPKPEPGKAADEEEEVIEF